MNADKLLRRAIEIIKDLIFDSTRRGSNYINGKRNAEKLQAEIQQYLKEQKQKDPIKCGHCGSCQDTTGEWVKKVPTENGFEWLCENCA